jgi:NADPH:quinone reductase
VAVVKEATGGRGADVVYDPVGGDAFRRSTKCIAFDGRILIIGFASGDIPQAAMNHALVKNYSIVGVHWGLYARLDPAGVRDCHAELTRLAAAGEIRTLVSERLSLAEVPDGIARLAAGTTTGRIVFIP